MSDTKRRMPPHERHNVTAFIDTFKNIGGGGSGNEDGSISTI